MNKTPLSAKTNRIIDGRAPSEYLGRLGRSTSIDPGRLDAILRSHLVDVEAMRSDDFDGFFDARQEALLGRIERATGKRIARHVEEVDAEDGFEEAS